MVIATIRQGGLGILTDPQRLNVAITQAVDTFLLLPIKCSEYSSFQEATDFTTVLQNQKY